MRSELDITESRVREDRETTEPNPQVTQCLGGKGGERWKALT